MALVWHRRPASRTPRSSPPPSGGTSHDGLNTKRAGVTSTSPLLRVVIDDLVKSPRSGYSPRFEFAARKGGSTTSRTVTGTWSQVARGTPHCAAPRCGVVKASRHPHASLCPRCNQWRTPSQMVDPLGVCGACAPRIQPVAAAAPHVSSEYIARRNAARALFLAEVEWLAGWDTEGSIARRLGCASSQALRRRLYRAGRADLVAALTAPQRVSAAA